MGIFAPALTFWAKRDATAHFCAPGETLARQRLREADRYPGGYRTIFPTCEQETSGAIAP
jgi:hypothetical protein